MMPDPRFPDPVASGLFARRTLLVTGVLDDARASDLAAQLMTLDATGDDPVHLHLDCRDATLAAALVVIDVVDLLGVPVHATCVGGVEGAAVGVLAVAGVRRITPHGRIRLGEPKVAFAGHAADVERWARHHQHQLGQLQSRLAAATGRPLEQVEADMHTGRYLDAEAAVAYGLVDEIWRRDRDAPARPPDFRFGFGPPGRWPPS
jgi:ATP-dependent Clp protease protease subunit